MTVAPGATSTRRRVVGRAIGAVGLIAMTVGVLGVRASAQEDTGCSQHPAYSALATAAAVHTVASGEGYSILSEAGADLPGAQAVIDSVLGSKGWAGAPYVPLAADNLAVGVGTVEQQLGTNSGLGTNNVPVFAVSEDPTHPEESKSTPAVNLSTKSTADSSTARAEGGGPGSNDTSMGRSTVSTAASCGSDGGLQALADNNVDMTAVGDVLRIASVRSHALVDIGPDGQIRKIEGTMSAEGATVLGQSVAITDKGLVLGSSPTPLPDNPLVKALKDADISVQYIAAESNRETGEVTAPGLAISVTRQPPAGTPASGGPITTTYVLGRAHARASLTSEGSSLPEDGTSDFASPTDLNGTGTFDPGSATAPASSTAPKTGAGNGGPEVALATTQIGSWSLAPAYSALGIGALLLVAWLLIEKKVVRFRWR